VKSRYYHRTENLAQNYLFVLANPNYQSHRIIAASVLPNKFGIWLNASYVSGHTNITGDVIQDCNPGSTINEVLIIFIFNLNDVYSWCCVCV